MAKRDIISSEPAVVDIPQQTPSPAGPIPGTVRLLNLRRDIKDITLLDGTNLRLRPHSKDNPRWSEPVYKKLLPEAARKMASPNRREILIREEVA